MNELRPWRRKHKRNELDSKAALEAFLAESSSPDLGGFVVQAVDLWEVSGLEQAQVQGALFIGCGFKDRAHELDLVQRGAAIFPRFSGKPYIPYRAGVYSVDELMAGYEEGGYTSTADFRIYTHFDRARRHPGGVLLEEQLAQRLHDHGIDDALHEVLEERSGRGVVAIMGGHGTRRSDPYFAKVAHATWLLTRTGYFVAGGGGPGIMEAANLGAFFANYSNPAIIEGVITKLSRADTFDGGEEEGTPAYLEAIQDYFRAGWEALEAFTGDDVPSSLGRERPDPGCSLAVPTWFYGHEPSNLFSTHIAKYFSNSLREDGLLAIATGGVIYAPGSAGTMQEIFMDLAQNHYATFAFRSPMVFLGRERYARLFELLQDFVSTRNMQEVYGDLLFLTDEPQEAVDFIAQHPPRLRAQKTPLYDLISD